RDCRVAVRVDEWKIVADETLTEFLLFDMHEDPQESSDVSAAYPEVHQRMKQALLKMEREVLGEGPDWWKGDSTSGVAQRR
ncbi:MAG: hypothetical protein AB7Q45_07525, partial [Planctomycetaceae bacterium]